MAKKKRKRRGHYCWSCERVIANERFSGKGHGKHLCQDCEKLGPGELAYRQALRDLSRCGTWEGIIPRKRRKQFQRFLEHTDPRIREAALEMQREDAVTRAQMRGETDEYEWEALQTEETGYVQFGIPTVQKPCHVILSDPDILGGTAVFAGTHVPVEALLDSLQAGDSLGEFLEHFPSVSREQAVAALQLAKEMLIAHAHMPWERVDAGWEGEGG